MARPRPSITPPTIPDRAYGNATARSIANLVPPSAYAACIRSKGVCAKISREMEVTIGIIMIARTKPAINGERETYGSGNLKSGIQPKYFVRSFAQYSAEPSRTKNPQSPNKTDGNAAIRSIAVTIIFLID